MLEEAKDRPRHAGSARLGKTQVNLGAARMFELDLDKRLDYDRATPETPSVS